MMLMMDGTDAMLAQRFESGRWLRICALGAALGLAAFLRFDGLATRSLWADEFCTWRVSRMPVGDSLRWGPELTKPPAYQLCLRAISADARPSERTLRVPAAVSGVLAVIVVWWLGSIAGGGTIGIAAALLFACNEMQIDYSQEARSYSMLVLGSALSTGLWYRLNVRHEGTKARRHGERWIWAVAFVIVTALTFHAHYLMSLTVAAQAVWWIMIRLPTGPHGSAIDEEGRGHRQRVWAGPIAMAVAGVLCVPVVWHYMRCRTSAFQGLDWITPPDLADAFSVLEKLTFGRVWMWGLLTPAAIAVLMTMVRTSRSPRVKKPKNQNVTKLESHSAPVGEEHRDAPRECHAAEGASGTHPAAEEGASGAHPAGFLAVAGRVRWSIGGSGAFCGLLLIWLAASWFGLMVISWLAHPAMVARYALPAAVPAILLPLIVAHRLHAKAPMLIAVVFLIASAGRWTGRSERVMPGFREMVEFFNEVIDPQREAVVVVIERTSSPGWEEMDRLGFEYYPMRRGEVHELNLRGGELDGAQSILRDPRALYLVTFLADADRAVRAAGRELSKVRLGDRAYWQLLFAPYRVQYVAPLTDSHDSATSMIRTAWRKPAVMSPGLRRVL